MSCGRRFLSLFRPPCYDCFSLGTPSDSLSDSPPNSIENGPFQARDSYLNSQQGQQVYLSVEEPFSGSILSDILGNDQDTSPEDWLLGIAQAALDVALEGTEAAQMSLLITDDETVHSLNAQFRGLDEVTDVLSFSAEHPGHWKGEAEPPSDSVEAGGFDFVMPPGELSPLGEVIVSYPQAQRQAEERGAPLEHELALLVVHGVLHLVGHDHLDPEETELMQAKERTALTKLNIKT
ncbi:MAG: rRNA maturation RNase YbeY [Chloroflexi bacterium]|nr:rRNA maturation RNase YbeY [Chloroflexota bacterium]